MNAYITFPRSSSLQAVGPVSSTLLPFLLPTLEQPQPSVVRGHRLDYRANAILSKYYLQARRLLTPDTPFASNPSQT